MTDWCTPGLDTAAGAGAAAKPKAQATFSISSGDVVVTAPGCEYTGDEVEFPAEEHPFVVDDYVPSLVFTMSLTGEHAGRPWFIPLQMPCCPMFQCYMQSL
jgi:hypothetical protein